ncbi:hypothetical protein [Dickeya oryzae]|uniref:Nucleotide modification associated domain-containing protein n=1 Tax=Dickeya oryzae TaxID=1240404 RepID=A0AB39IDI0_9GAMM|nr:hypothetical protein [Dickeya oryzae]MCA6996821.1 hypothetical protein [Dickeya oryzae]
MQLFSYKMTHDTGFAPNPFGETLTLSTCKPRFRLSKQVGQWIAGFTSAALTGEPVGEERLVYLMRIGEKILIRDYYYDPRFLNKRPGETAEGRCGDNIYCPVIPTATDDEHFELIANPHHNEGDKKIDTSGRYVLIADEFYYFGKNALVIPAELCPAIPRSQSAHGRLTTGEQVVRFIDYIRHHYSPGRHSWPTCWRDDEASSPCGNACAIKTLPSWDKNTGVAGKKKRC